MDDNRILILDDDEAVRISLELFMEDHDFVVFSAPSAEEALEIVSKEEIDVVLVDLRLPGIDGFDFIRKSKDEIYHIVMTGSEEVKDLPEDLKKANNVSNNIFFKPIIKMQLLIEEIKKAKISLEE